MKSIADQLATIEDRLKTLRSQLLPLEDEVRQWNRRIDACFEQLKELGSESNTLQEKIAGTATGFDEVFALLAGAKNEGRQIAEEQRENQHLRDSMTSMFSEAFQVVSRFVDTAQKIGILDKEKAASFLAAKKRDLEKAEATDEAPAIKAEEASIVEPVVETTEITTEAEEIPAKEPTVETTEIVAETEEIPAEEPVVETTEIVAEAEEIPAEEPAVETTEIVAEVEPEEMAAEIAKLSLPSLPDVTSSVESLPPVDEAEVEAETKSSAEIASQLDLPPLQLETPAAENESDSGHEADEDQIEALLTDLSQPIST